MSINNNYIIQGGQEGKERLNVLAEILSGYTQKIIAPDGYAITGKKFLDVGCGGGNVSLMVSEMVGKDGYVTGVDFDAEIIKLATQDAKRLKITNVDFKDLNVYDLQYDDVFDIAYSRFLLSHLERPKNVLNKMLLSLKPGGRIIIEDIDFSGHFCHPNCDEFDLYLHLFTAAATNNGQNPDIGLSLFDMFTECGIENIQFDVIQPCHSKGSGKWMAYYTLEKIKNTVIKQGLVEAKEFEEILQGLKNFTEDPNTIISLPRIFRVWGTRPE